MAIKVLKRDIQGKQVKQLRAQGLVPASIYGAARKESLNVALDEKTLRDAFKQYGYSQVFDLEVEGENKPVKAVFKELQVDPVKAKIVHVSFHQIQMDQKITAEVPLVFTGVSMAVKNNLGLLVTSLSSISVVCLPDKLPSSIEVDISHLDEVGNTIELDKFELPEGVEVGHGTPKDSVIAYISAPQKIEEETPVATTTAEGEAAIPVEGEEGAEAPVEEGKEGKEGKETKKK